MTNRDVNKHWRWEEVNSHECDMASPWGKSNLAIVRVQISDFSFHIKMAMDRVIQNPYLSC